MAWYSFFRVNRHKIEFITSERQKRIVHSHSARSDSVNTKRSLAGSNRTEKPILHYVPQWSINLQCERRNELIGQILVNMQLALTRSFRSHRVQFVAAILQSIAMD